MLRAPEVTMNLVKDCPVRSNVMALVPVGRVAVDIRAEVVASLTS
jgi:hypothetical protein